MSVPTANPSDTMFIDHAAAALREARATRKPIAPVSATFGIRGLDAGRLAAGSLEIRRVAQARDEHLLAGDTRRIDRLAVDAAGVGVDRRVTRASTSNDEREDQGVSHPALMAPAATRLHRLHIT